MIHFRDMNTASNIAFKFVLPSSCPFISYDFLNLFRDSLFIRAASLNSMKIEIQDASIFENRNYNNTFRTS